MIREINDFFLKVARGLIYLHLSEVKTKKEANNLTLKRNTKCNA